MGGVWTLLPLWTERDSFQSRGPKYQLNWKKDREGNLAFNEYNRGMQHNSQLPASVLYSRKGARGGGTLFPLWIETDGCNGGGSK